MRILPGNARTGYSPIWGMGREEGFLHRKAAKDAKGRGIGGEEFLQWIIGNSRCRPRADPTAGFFDQGKLCVLAPLRETLLPVVATPKKWLAQSRQGAKEEEVRGQKV